jgi:hypothetical protein
MERGSHGGDRSAGAVTWTFETMQKVCQIIAAGRTVPKALKEIFGDDSPGIVASFLQAALYGEGRLQIMYREARRRQAHGLIDRAVDVSDEANTKEQAYASRVKSEIYMRAAEAWSPTEFGRNFSPNVGVVINVHTSLGGPPQNNLPAEGFHVVVPATTPLFPPPAEPPTDEETST